MFERLRLRRAIATAAVLFFGFAALSGCGAAKPEPGSTLEVIVDQGGRKVDVRGAEPFTVQCIGRTAVVYGNQGSIARLPDEASVFLCQGPGGGLPIASEVSEWLQIGQLP